MTSGDSVFIFQFLKDLPDKIKSDFLK